MKRFIYSILLILFVGLWLVPQMESAVTESLGTVEMEYGDEKLIGSEPSDNKIISVLSEANSKASLSSRHNHSFFSHHAKRHKNSSNSWNKMCRNLCSEKNINQQIDIKNNIHLSDEQQARLKHAGYYIYNLRKIII